MRFRAAALVGFGIGIAICAGVGAGRIAMLSAQWSGFDGSLPGAIVGIAVFVGAVFYLDSRDKGEPDAD